MKKLSIVFFILLVLVVANQANAKVYKIAIIDSGIHYKNMVLSKDYKSKIKLCKTGHKNYLDGSTDVKDSHGHGTHIAGLIASQMKDTDYCFVILKIYHSQQDNVGYNNAIKDAINLKVDAINISGGGLNFDKRECRAAKQATNANILLVVAAGNEGTEISKFIKKRNRKKRNRKSASIKKYFFPASCDNDKIVVVGNGSSAKDLSKTSNYGDVVDIYISGDNAFVFGEYMTGTSQSTAIVTGRIVNEAGKTRLKGAKSGKETVTRKKSNK